ncbi:sugar ABC transporter permease [candidate division WOR-3 bacterium]|nr:sugar ABC transporter permease [candidate division WOR-3 bacterium]
MSREVREAFSFMLPLIIFVFFLMLLPVIGTFWVSQWQDISFLPRKYVGLENYIRLFKDPQFGQSLWFTLIFSFTSVLLEMVAGMIIALVLNESFRLRGIMRGISLLPWAIPSVVGARIWQLIYRYDYGLANCVLEKISGLSINWLGSSGSAFLSLVLADSWRTTPFVAIIILAGLQSVPESLYEQAKIDGANLIQRLFRITLPVIKPVVIVALIFRTIDALRVFDVIYVITGGGPGSFTTSVSLYSYKYFLMGDFGYGSTVSIFLFIIAFSIVALYIKIGRFKEIAL